MENKQENKQELTKGAAVESKQDGVVISTKEAAEYCEFKKQRKRMDIRNAIIKSEGVLTDNGEAKKICERAVKHRQAAVRMTPITLEYARPWVAASGIKVDCLIGGNGDTLSKVKIYEAKCALKLKAKELTVAISPSMLAECRYSGIRRELKRLRRVAGKTVLKARLDKRYSPERLACVEKICSEVGVDFLSLPLYDGCERARLGLGGKCRLEVFGVETIGDYQKMAAAGVARIVTERVEEIQAEWLKEVDRITFPKPSVEMKKAEEMPAVADTAKNAPYPTPETTPKTVGKAEDKPQQAEKTKEEIKPEVKSEEKTLRERENDYQCRLEGAELKFL